MSRSVCTNRSSIVLMSFEKKPMTSFLSCLGAAAISFVATALSIGNVQRGQGFPRGLHDPRARMPCVRPWNPEQKRFEQTSFNIDARKRRTLIIRLRAIGEARVAEAGSDGQDAPVLHVLHERHLAQTLHHAVVVHERDRLVSADLGNGLTQACRKVEAIALPIAGK